ncbi:TetR/AcrR family transcriptional regulator [Pseudonocardia nigra]|uniref:TetR/AcrR family transcriptional regulator n=1 Tax=Pseudonocardia nigra TaxID=1921578 RepID=UPI001C5D470C|nr:TetR/AcrR family transcriptional regulator [Pseudonocardia nigra]
MSEISGVGVGTDETASRVAGSDADERRKQIIDRAARLFDRSGYAGVKMDDIAKTVGIAKPTLYHYFRSKDEILYGIHNTCLDLVLDRHQARLAAGLDGKHLLLEIMSDILELMETHRGHLRALFEHDRDLPTEQWDVIRGKRDRYESMVRAVIRDGVDRGEFRNVDPRLATQALLGMCNWAYHWYGRAGQLRPREIAYSFWNFIIYGLQMPNGDIPETPWAADATPRKRSTRGSL